MQTQCKRCLLRDLTDSDYFKTVYDYIESLPRDIKTSDGEYARRLSICGECTCLVNGMCSLCGCFVEVRAAKSMNHCAKSSAIW